MKVAEVRKRYLDFMREKGHVIIPSAPIVPGNDPTTLFTSSGMQPLLPYFLGKDHPEGKRVADSQLAFRAGDIEEVGDNRHTTFFEMLGNWSFGDYFKKEQLPWIFEFLTDGETGFGIDPAKLYVTTFAGDPAAGIPADDEAVAIWQELFTEKGVDAEFVNLGTEERGYELGMQGDLPAGRQGRIFAYGDKNWWSRAGAPGKMPAGEPGGPDSEIFYDFGTPHDPKWGPRCHPNCDCGRFVEIGNSVFMQYIKSEDGRFTELPKKNIDFGGGLERLTMATVGPDIFLIDIFDAARAVLERRSGGQYGSDEGATRAMRIILDHMRAASFMLAEGITPANTEAGYILRRLIRRSIREADRLGIKEAVLAEVAGGFGAAYAKQYPMVEQNAAFITEQLEKEEAQFRKTLAQGLREFERLTHYGSPTSVAMIPAEEAVNLYTTYGFPIELTEELAKERGLQIDLGAVADLMRKHQQESRAGAAQKFAGGLADHQAQTIKYHTTHHILLKALQMVLGGEVKQRGSNITSERLRIDFSFPRKMTDEEKKKVEEIVNDTIRKDLPVVRTVMKKEEAEKLGAQMEFGVKYPEMVSVYSVGPLGATEADPKIPEAFSLEFCGGPHVANTAEIHEGGKHFKIQKEEASSASVRRIKAILG
ncbi:MAG TPA: alanine--tRNA ligase-related protein [Candidatus Paceibacterota bacterium]|nr:alanine--tRNA ligase-related protein [Candidatus Paceibacterota bacterium]